MCINIAGSFNCECNTGYALDDDGFTCNEVDECSDGTHDCSQTCTNTNGSYICGCNTGYKLILEADGVLCNDTDECSERKDDCSQICINTNGSYICECEERFRLDKDGVTCNADTIVIGLIVAYSFASLFCLIYSVLIFALPFCICHCLGINL